VEYGLLLALVAAMVLTGVAALGDGVEESFERTCRALGGGPAHAGSPPGRGVGIPSAPGLARRRC
jgi:Flp pilus assembly pilin Flp